MRHQHRIIYTPRASHGARVLANALQWRRVGAVPLKRLLKGPKLIVNWGSSEHPRWATDEDIILNPSDKVVNAVNKLRFFQMLKEAGYEDGLEWTTSRAQAKGWQRAGRQVFERHALNGHSGRGVRVVKPADPLQDCPLYTRGYAKTHEYRIHVFDGNPIEHAEKRRRLNPAAGVANGAIRTWDNGWVYSSRLSVSEAGLRSMDQAAGEVLELLGLDFGAVDVLAQLEEGVDGARRLKGFRICEVNTAPGLEKRSTIEAYAYAFNDFVTKKGLR